MPMIGMLICICVAFAICIAIHLRTRFRDINVRSVISSLEWLATQEVEPRDLDRDRDSNRGIFYWELEKSRKLYLKVSKIYFSQSFFNYCIRINRISGVELHWANRFAAELRSFSMTLLQSSRESNLDIREDRSHMIGRHISDFNKAASIVLLGRDRYE